MREIFPIIKRIVLYIFLTGATILMSFPLFWMISSSLKILFLDEFTLCHPLC